MASRLFAFINWGLVAVTLAVWGVLTFRPSAAPVPEASPAGAGGAATALVAGEGTALSRLLGAPLTPSATDPTAIAVAPESSRFKLEGVMAPRRATTSAAESTTTSNAPSTPRSTSRTGTGWALISVDGNPPRIYAIGDRVDGEWRLQSVALRSASLGQSNQAAVVQLVLPTPAAPSTGTLAPAVAMPLDEFANPSVSAPSLPTQAAPSFTPPAPPFRARTLPQGADLPVLSSPPAASPAASRPSRGLFGAASR